MDDASWAVLGFDSAVDGCSAKQERIMLFFVSAAAVISDIRFYRHKVEPAGKTKARTFRCTN